MKLIKQNQIAYSLVILIPLSLLLNACQSLPYQPYARNVKQKSNINGIIALKPEHRDEDRQKAMTMMQANCQALPVKIIEEGEVVIGQESTTNSNTSKSRGTGTQQVGSLFGIPMVAEGHDPSESTASKVLMTQVKEWQINYECVSSTNNKKSTVK